MDVNKPPMKLADDLVPVLSIVRIVDLAPALPEAAGRDVSVPVAEANGVSHGAGAPGC